LPVVERAPAVYVVRCALLPPSRCVRSQKPIARGDALTAKLELDRDIERWARHLLLVDKDGVRRLTEEEVQAAVGRKRRRS
jgi:hypothetical protein